MSASNNRECFIECIGLKVVGVLFDALPWSARDIARGTKTLVFSDGTGLTFSSNGAFWRETADEVATAIEHRKRELSDAQTEIRGVLGR